MHQAFLGTRDGLYRLENGTLIPLGLEGHYVTAMHARYDEAGHLILLAGSYGDGLFRSKDDGQTWTRIEQGLTASAFRTFLPDPFDATAVLCGTEPGRIFRSADSGLTWTEFDAIRSISHVDEWFLPYSPRAGAVRNMYSPVGTERLLASVEVGGLLDSPDQGATWTCGPILGDTDIHYITGHPTDSNILYAALGWAKLGAASVPANSPSLGGVARSLDGGQTWTKLFSDYTRAVIVPPSNPELVLAGPATEVGDLGRIQVSADDGDSWTSASHGIETPMEDIVEEFVVAPDQSIWAIRSGGSLYRTEPGDWHWQPVIDPEIGIQVRSVAFIR